jgi:hypothetical protein
VEQTLDVLIDGRSRKGVVLKPGTKLEDPVDI